MSADRVADVIRLRRAASECLAEADQLEQALVDELMASVDRHPSGGYRCCDGWGEHFDHCEVGQDIAAARWRIARSQVLRFPPRDAS